MALRLADICIRGAHIPQICPSVYFNDNDIFVCRWLRNLYPDAKVDRRSISVIRGEEVASYKRVHLFAGIGGWEYALSLAGWPEDRPIWTGSCPCQPFSTAGKRKADNDERNLWPEMYRLIKEQRPPTVFGEQVASPLGRTWLAGVRNGLEEIGYAVGAVDMPACGVGAPYLRQRLYWVARRGEDSRVADTNRSGYTGGSWEWGATTEGRSSGYITKRSQSKRMDNTDGSGHGGHEPSNSEQSEHTDQPEANRHPSEAGVLSPGLGHTAEQRLQARQASLQQWRSEVPWTEFEILQGIDGSQRRIEPGTSSLVDGFSGRVGRSSNPNESILSTSEARVGRLKGYGNAIVPQLAAIFIRSFLEAEQELLS